LIYELFVDVVKIPINLNCVNQLFYFQAINFTLFSHTCFNDKWLSDFMRSMW